MRSRKPNPITIRTVIYRIVLLLGLSSAQANLFPQSLYASELEYKDGKHLSQNTVQKSVHETLHLLNEVYVYPDKARKIQFEMIERMEQGAYDHINSKVEFSTVISSELREISRDSHLSVRVIRDYSHKPTHILTETEDSRKYNFAFQKLEVLSGNIGYMKFNKFYQDEEATAVVDHAFGFLSGTDAMIIDLRDCIGGSPELVRYMLSYFFEKTTKLWSVYDRSGESSYDVFSIEDVGGKQFKKNYPLFILAGPNTASAAEYFAYTLKHFGKAETVGEITRGAAHMVGAKVINKYFYGRFSMSRPVNPITKGDWEGVGVIPDIASNSGLSLDVAHSEALMSLGLDVNQSQKRRLVD